MQLDVENIDDGLTVFNLSGPINAATELHSFLQATSLVKARGTHTILLNFSGVSRISMAGLAAVVEFCGRPTGVEIGLVALPKKALRSLENKGLDYGLDLFEGEENAFAKYKSNAVSQTTSILTCSQKLKLPSGTAFPTVLIDVLGLSLLERALRHLKRFGCCRCILVAGENLDEIAEHLKESRLSLPAVFLVPETVNALETLFSGAAKGQLWNRLWNLHLQLEDYALLFDPTIVAPFDPANMIREHRRNASFLTVCSGQLGELKTDSLANVSSALVSSKFVASLRNGVPRIGDMNVYKSLDFDAHGGRLDHVNDIGSYHRLIAQAVRQRGVDWLSVDLADERNLVSADAVAEEKKIDIEGQCYIDPSATVGTQVTLSGTCSIGAKATVSDRCYLRNCIVLPGAVVPSGTWANDHVFEASTGPTTPALDVLSQAEKPERFEIWG